MGSSENIFVLRQGIPIAHIEYRDDFFESLQEDCRKNSQRTEQFDQYFELTGKCLKNYLKNLVQLKELATSKKIICSYLEEANIQDFDKVIVF